MKPIENSCVAIIGLGYVGLPLAVAFGKKMQTIGFDLNKNRVKELQEGADSTLEIEPEDLLAAEQLTFIDDPKKLAGANIFISTVPTPITKSKTPDLTPLLSASKTIGQHLKKGDLVIYESTVYPGATEEQCVPI
ncbi:MAG: Vi polysaccharide biosynthesis UDP-N-acetylglucosamine C-6 dehydrogenase TviB, partial [Gammaproteobacteria bacterium]|nr:Vi polysaccharide biosynthesis UDP-N-acetylglucosamine C-6 dehydrogenase TviB [Gammaproteobacteria bacterium]